MSSSKETSPLESRSMDLNMSHALSFMWNFSLHCDDLTNSFTVTKPLPSESNSSNMARSASTSLAVYGPKWRGTCLGAGASALSRSKASRSASALMIIESVCRIAWKSAGSSVDRAAAARASCSMRSLRSSVSSSMKRRDMDLVRRAGTVTLPRRTATTAAESPCSTSASSGTAAMPPSPPVCSVAHTPLGEYSTLPPGDEMPCPGPARSRLPTALAKSPLPSATRPLMMSSTARSRPDILRMLFLRPMDHSRRVPPALRLRSAINPDPDASSGSKPPPPSPTAPSAPLRAPLVRRLRPWLRSPSSTLRRTAPRTAGSRAPFLLGAV
mmetsp:Transcript_2981/g.10679  ORF Transcript_2981/g.10679 Transcript_2981/m.10679 type:complete len:327 (+) Transcript_2981:455-1435(+)